MVRPQASKLNKQLGMLFANAVTVPILHPSRIVDTIGRNGAHSVFEVFTQVCPEATRNHSRDGATEAELNKVLEHAGFERVRMRASAGQITGKLIDRKSCYRFGRRRWLDPDDAADMAEICKACQQMHEIAGLQSTFSVSRLVEILKETIASENAEKWSKKKHLKTNQNLIARCSTRSDPAAEVCCSSVASDADTAESLSPSFFVSDECETNDNLPSLVSDKTALKLKLQTEPFSIEGPQALLAASQQEQEQLPCEVAWLPTFVRDSWFAVQEEQTETVARDIELTELVGEDSTMSLYSEGLMSIFEAHKPEDCFTSW
eukprot:3931592-Rhodomonas_salina.1